MSRARRLLYWAALVCVGLLTTPLAASDHTHLSVLVEVPAGETSGEGDALGIYAMQLQPCQASPVLKQRAHSNEPTYGWTRMVVERLMGALVATAHANHRDRFDGPAEGEFRMRVALDRAGNTSIGELVVPAARYCRVLLTLARLPAAKGLPALENSLRLSMPGAAPLEIAFRESIALTLIKPWVADGTVAQLKFTLRPRAAQALLANQSEDFGALSQRVVSRLTEASSAAVSLR